MSTKPGWGATKRGPAIKDPEFDDFYLPVKRPNHPFNVREGLRVMLSRGPWTPKKILRTPFRFQCPPLDSLTKAVANAWNDYDTIEKGQYDRAGGIQLVTIAFQSLFQDFDSPYVIWTGRGAAGAGETFNSTAFDPLAMQHDLEFLVREAVPFWLTIGQNTRGASRSNDPHDPTDLNLPAKLELLTENRWHDDIHFAATLRSVETEMRGGETDTRYVNVSFTEHRRSEVQRRKRKGEAFDDKDPKLFRVTRRYNTLYKVAKKVYGDPTYWWVIARANRLRIYPSTSIFFAYKYPQVPPDPAPLDPEFQSKMNDIRAIEEIYATKPIRLKIPPIGPRL